jgi:hypothetical protein
VFSKASQLHPFLAFLNMQIVFKKALSASDHQKLPSSRALCDVMQNKICISLAINQVFSI